MTFFLHKSLKVMDGWSCRSCIYAQRDISELSVVFFPSFRIHLIHFIDFANTSLYLYSSIPCSLLLFLDFFASLLSLLLPSSLLSLFFVCLLPHSSLFLVIPLFSIPLFFSSPFSFSYPLTILDYFMAPTSAYRFTNC